MFIQKKNYKLLQKGLNFFLKNMKICYNYHKKIFNYLPHACNEQKKLINLLNALQQIYISHINQRSTRRG